MSNSAEVLLRVWEREVIYKWYPQGGYRACQLHGVERTQSSIQSHAHRLGLGETRYLLTVQDKDIISTVYPLGGIPLIREMTNLLDRFTVSTIRRWANNQGYRSGTGRGNQHSKMQIRTATFKQYTSNVRDISRRNLQTLWWQIPG